MKTKKFQFIAKNVIGYEIEALKKLKASIGSTFDKAVKTILNCKNGKIIISGVGKSGIIGKKWTATFSSIGIPSFFLDASNASHGDMGQITSNDIVILISLSGQSEELKNIIQFASRNKNIKLIGITSKKDSILYKNSDVKFLMPSVKEADPGNIVPTSSTTIQLVLGDAIAIACMKYNKFGKLDFKKFHPGGSLSVKLKTVSDLMLTGNKIPFVSENTTLKDALGVIAKKGLGMILIKKRNVTTGILTDGDLKRLNRKFENFEKLKIKTVMKKNPVSIEKNTTIGIIHIHDILKANIS